MRNTRSVFKPWFAWNPGKIELFLEEMASRGWKIDQVRFSQMWFRFVKGEEGKICFCVDYQGKPDEEYKQILLDDDWKLINSSAGWMLWSKPYTGERPRLYTDRMSIIDRNRRIVAVIGLCLLAQFPAITTNAFARVTERYLGSWPIGGDIFIALYTLMIFLLIYGMIRLLLVNRSLNE